ncbi:MAG: TetR/AcrR family transcriptional regulator [Ilumatobacter sp.]|uniref:TetR/AcrR family transcriptional regulator n=1 Tax=Ilumatobacter sp. TaxID=1967498 RepID=UPI0026102563|nr:TetR/AcrR family transcriptional regulator [Ilumatobacter sp.]MDJ0768983.1 TetR/AcrR family transcriptional regulator [Ilumatobacter sp.]
MDVQAARSADVPVTDGRRARRERGRVAVIDAMIDLVFEGHSPPPAELVAERAGISMATLFRYFETLDDLRQETTNRYIERYAHLFDIPDARDGDVGARIAVFVDARVTLYETVAPIARLARWRAAEVAAVDDTLHRLRAERADQVRRHFDDELARLTPAARDDMVTIIATLTSFESWDQARHDHERSPAQLRRTWVTALTRLLTP